MASNVEFKLILRALSEHLFAHGFNFGYQLPGYVRVQAVHGGRIS
jgi:hypothetical protein